MTTISNTQAELLPCPVPWCGKPAKRVSIDDKYFVTRCSAITGCFTQTAIYLTQEEADKVWNRRAPVSGGEAPPFGPMVILATNHRYIIAGNKVAARKAMRDENWYGDERERCLHVFQDDKPFTDVRACPADSTDKLIEALHDAINSSKGVVPVTAEPFYEPSRFGVSIAAGVAQTSGEE